MNTTAEMKERLLSMGFDSRYDETQIIYPEKMYRLIKIGHTLLSYIETNDVRLPYFLTKFKEEINKIFNKQTIPKFQYSTYENLIERKKEAYRQILKKNERHDIIVIPKEHPIYIEKLDFAEKSEDDCDDDGRIFLSAPELKLCYMILMRISKQKISIRSVIDDDYIGRLLFHFFRVPLKFGFMMRMGNDMYKLSDDIMIDVYVNLEVPICDSEIVIDVHVPKGEFFVIIDGVIYYILNTNRMICYTKE